MNIQSQAFFSERPDPLTIKLVSSRIVVIVCHMRRAHLVEVLCALLIRLLHIITIAHNLLQKLISNLINWRWFYQLVVT